MKNLFVYQSIYSALAGASTMLASFVSGVVVANLLGVEGAGMVAFAVWIALVVTPIVDGGTALSVGRFQGLLKGQSDTAAARALPGLLARRLLLFNILGLLLITALYLTGEASALRLPSDEDFSAGIPPLLAVGVASLTLLQSLALFGTAYLRGSRRFVVLAALSLVSMSFQIAAVYAGIRLAGVVGAVVGYALGQFLLSVVTICLLWRGGTVQSSLLREVRRYGRFAWAANICNTFVWSRIEIFFLQFFWTYREVGLFSVALALAALASQGPLLLTSAFLPMLSEKHGQGDRAGLQRAFSGGTRLLAILAFPACFGMVSIVPVLAGILYGPAFEPSVPATMIISAAAAFSISAVIGTHLVNALARSDFIFFSSLAGAVMSALLGLLLIPDGGLIGAAVARAVTQLSMIGLGLWFITSTLNFSYPFGYLLRILAATLAATVCAYLATTSASGIPGLISAIAAFIPVYVVGLRLFRAVHPEDAEMMRGLSRSLPRPFAHAIHHFLLFVQPSPASQPV